MNYTAIFQDNVLFTMFEPTIGSIPIDPNNRDYQELQIWLAEGNTTATLYLTTSPITASITLTTAGNYTITAGITTIDVNKMTGQATTIYLPANGAGFSPITITDAKGDASSNNITLSGNINNASSYVMNVDQESITIRDTGTQWEII